MLTSTRQYMRTIAFSAIMTTTWYAGLVVVPDFLSATITDIVDPTQAIPRAYLLTVFLLSIRILQKPSQSLRSRRAIRGILEGSLIAYSLIAVIYFLRTPDQSSDHLFHWVTFYLVLCVIGPLLSSLGVAIYLLFPNISHME